MSLQKHRIRRAGIDAGRRRRSLLMAALTCLCLLVAATTHADDQGRDPWEAFNRKVFVFNDAIDRWALEPLARGWRFAVGETGMVSLDNISETLRAPVYLFNNLVQLKPRAAFDVVQRTVLNSTLGVAGIIDIAADIGIPSPREDFGQSLARWDVPSGPYVVLPLLGPSTVRDAGGLLVDTPLLIWPYFINSIFITTSYTAGVTVNTRALLLDEIATAKSGALDYYALARNAYLQRRDALIADHGEAGPQDNEDELYYFDFE